MHAIFDQSWREEGDTMEKMDTRLCYVRMVVAGFRRLLQKIPALRVRNKK